jgi:hypothetical protein
MTLPMGRVRRGTGSTVYVRQTWPVGRYLWSRVSDEEREHRATPVLAKHGVSVWIPGRTLRTSLTCQLLVREQSIEITTRPRFLGRILGFNWLVPGKWIRMSTEYRPYEIGREHPWIAIGLDRYAGYRKICLRMRDMDKLTAILKGVGASEGPEATNEATPEE